MYRDGSMDLSHARIAYLSMEIGIRSAMPTYSGGLGLLAGDVARAAADLAAPMVFVTLLYREGYFHQRLDETQWQHEDPVRWEPRNHCTPLGVVASVALEGREVRIAAWRCDVAPHASGGRAVPIILLDTDLPENDPYDRAITHGLYAGDPRHRVRQEAVLGIGAVRALKALGASNLKRWHLNEGHAAFAVCELGLKGHVTDASPCIFTTHTPIAAGHDRFPMWLVRDVLGEPFAARLYADAPDAVLDDILNMTMLAAWRSRAVLGVSHKHGEVSRKLLGMPEIGSVTNGVHGAFWTDRGIAALLDRYAQGWREDPARASRAQSIPLAELGQAHADAKRRLVERINRETNAGFDADAFTIAFARRATAYKRPDMLLSRPDHLREIARRVGPIQIVMGGKAHPHDHAGKMLMQKVMRTMNGLTPDIRCAYLPNYDIDLAQSLVSGADVWVNLPIPPLEASGTSGMKAACNGVPSLSTWDGWWMEGGEHGVTGWTVGDGREGGAHDDADVLYHLLEHEIVPLFYKNQEGYLTVMRNAIAKNAPRFAAARMVQDYLKVYGL